MYIYSIHWNSTINLNVLRKEFSDVWIKMKRATILKYNANKVSLYNTLIIVPDRALCTRYFVFWKYRTQFVYDNTRTVHQLTRLMCQNMELHYKQLLVQINDICIYMDQYWSYICVQGWDVGLCSTNDVILPVSVTIRNEVPGWNES